MIAARAGSAAIRPMSQTPCPAASASSPGRAYDTYTTGTPTRCAISCAMAGATPAGSPVGLEPLTSKKLDRLIPARRTAVGASSAMTSCSTFDDIGTGPEMASRIDRSLDRRRAASTGLRAYWRGQWANATGGRRHQRDRSVFGFCSPWVS
jgi:hypothetical protein